jgi:hypothetical protein
MNWHQRHYHRQKTLLNSASQFTVHSSKSLVVKTDFYEHICTVLP